MSSAVYENDWAVCNSQVVNGRGQESTPGSLRLPPIYRGQESSAPIEGQPEQGRNCVDLPGLQCRPQSREVAEESDATDDAVAIDYSSSAAAHMESSTDSTSDPGHAHGSWVISSMKPVTDWRRLLASKQPSLNSELRDDTTPGSAETSPRPLQIDTNGEVNGCGIAPDTGLRGSAAVHPSTADTERGEGSSHDGGGTSTEDDEEGTYLRFSGFEAGLKAKGKTRNRTIFTSSQLDVLEREFRKHKYISKPRRIELSTILNIHERNVTVWFQNRRSKLKRSCSSSDLSPPPAPAGAQPPSLLESNLRQLYSSSPTVYGGASSTLASLLSSLPFSSHSKPSSNNYDTGSPRAGHASLVQSHTPPEMPTAYHQLAAWAMYASALNKELALQSSSQYSPLLQSPLLKAALYDSPSAPTFPAATAPKSERPKKLSDHFRK